MDTQNQQAPIPGVTPTVALPSADLIVYRFDSMDKQMANLSAKMDAVASTFLTKEEAALMRQEREDKLNALAKRIDKMQSFAYGIAVAVIGALTMSIASVLIHR